MNKMTSAITLLAGMGPVSAMACPDGQGSGERIEWREAAGIGVAVRHVMAGGWENVARCSGIDSSERPVGYVATNPDFVIDVPHSYDGELIFETGGSCDTTLLVLTGNRNWFFNDDGDAGLNGRIALNQPSAGLYRIWVGTCEEDLCSSMLTVATHQRGTSDPVLGSYAPQ